MAKKAGRLAVGSQAVASAARRGEATLIITANDASEASIRRAKSNAEINAVRYNAVPYTMFELGRSAGRGSPGTVAFLDKGLGDGFLKRLEEKLPDKKEDGQADSPDRPAVNRRTKRRQTAEYADNEPQDVPTSNRRTKRRLTKKKESDA